MSEIGKQKNLDKIFDTQQEYLEEKSKIMDVELIANRGSFILSNDKKYYIYGEEGTSWMVFELQDVYKENYDVLNINGNDFYTCYSELLIDKKEPLTPIYNCTLDEIDLIKSKRKSYKIKHNLIKTVPQTIKNI